MTISSKWYGVDLDDDQETLLDWLRDFCEKEMRPNGAKYHKSAEIPWDIIGKAAKAEIYSQDFLEKLFFGDPTGKLAALAIAELFRADAGIALSIFGTGLPAMAIMANATKDQREKWLPLCFGTKEKPALAAFASSEAEAGSDVSMVRATAVFSKKDGEDDDKGVWTLNGVKAWITNGGKSDVHVVNCVVDPSLGVRGHALFIVPPGTPGLSQGSKYDKTGFRASHTAEVVLDNVVVPADCVLGGKQALDDRLSRARNKQSAGGQGAMATFEGTRWMVAAMGVGIAQAAYEYSLAYAKERVQGGKAIIEHQQIAEMLADMATEIYLARLGVIDAAHTYLTTGKLSLAQGSMVKYFATELAVKVSRNAVQILGGAGYTNDHPVAQWLNDALLLTIFEGTSQVQKNVIASTVSGVRIR